MKKTYSTPVSFSTGVQCALYLLLMTGLYLSTGKWLIEKDWAREDYNYGYLVPVIVLYLLWEKKDVLLKMVSVPAWNGGTLIGLGILFYTLGELSGEFFTLYMSFWLITVGLFWLHMGWQKLKEIAFALFFMLTMFPLPNFLNAKVTLKLQLISSQFGVFIIQLYGLSAYREGNVIDLGFTQLQVVEACSGLRFLIPLLVLGLLLAYFYRAALWKRAVVIIATIPLSIVTNSLRIALTGILFKSWGRQVAEGFFHGFSGWFIFMFSLAVLLGIMWVLNLPWWSKTIKGTSPSTAKQLGLEKANHSDESANEGLAGAEGTTTPTDKVSSTGWRDLLNPPQFVVAAILMAMLLLFSQQLKFREKIPPSRPFSEFPLDVESWRGVRQIMEKRFIQELDFSDYIMVDYRDPQSKAVNFYVAYYESQRKGESIHSPASCLPGGGWEFRQSGTVPLPSGKAGTITVNRVIMQLGNARQVAYYWFPKAGRVLTNAYQLKIYTFWDALTRQRTDGALVRLITTVYGGEDLAAAENRLKEFSRQILPVLDGFLPE